jgi:HlyD family type I secretion membrane fusion protein
MKMDLGPVRSTYVAPTFGGDDNAPLAPQLQRRLRRPMLVGAVLIAVFVVGLGAWATFTTFPMGVTAPGEIRIESNRKTLRARDAGTVKQILVKEGELVHAQQPLLLFNDVEARAAFDVLQNQYDVLEAQNARFSAEATRKTSLQMPAELTARMSDPRVAQMIRDQQFLFATRLSLFQSQSAVLNQRIEQLETQVKGLQAQLDSMNTQIDLTQQQLDSYKKLNEQGFASRNLVLQYERTVADLQGRRGSLIADIARTRQQMGETKLQLASLANQRASESAEGLRDSQAKMAEISSRLTAARQTLDRTVVRAPTNGYVFNLTQFTPGGVVGAGELLMDVVPTGTPLTVTAMVSPMDIERVQVGQPARVRLTGLNYRFNSDLNAKVTVVSADRITNDKNGQSYYRVDLQIPPTELTKLKRDIQLTPGMPASATIVHGKRSVMGFLISPITDTLRDAFREE